MCEHVFTQFILGVLAVETRLRLDTNGPMLDVADVDEEWKMHERNETETSDARKLHPSNDDITSCASHFHFF